MVLKIGINGFGRIGRVTYRALLEKKRLFYTLTKNGTLSNPCGTMFQGHFFLYF